MILVCVDHSFGYLQRTAGEPIERGRYASSVWLAIQNLFLAARAPGPGHPHHDRSHKGRSQNQGVPGYPRACRDRVPHALGISERPVRPHRPETRRLGHVV